MTTLSPGFNDSRVTPWPVNAPAPPHSTPQRCISPFSSGAMTCTQACGLRNMNCTSSPSILTVLLSSYVAVNE